MPDACDDVVHRLAEACRTGDVAPLLSPGAFAVCDGGGFVAAPVLPLHGADEVAWLLGALLPGNDLAIESVNGHPGLVMRRTGRAVAVIAVTCDRNVVTALWVVLNPAKLRVWNRGA
jgi:hypothetical protein